MAAGSTYTPITTTTLGSAQASVTLNSFSGYTDLILIGSVKTTNSTSAVMRAVFNSDSGSNYSVTRLLGNGSSASSDRYSNQTTLDIGYLPGADGSGFGLSIVQLQNYSNSTTYKSVLNRWNSEAGATSTKYTTAGVGLWRSTSAITSILIDFSAGNIATGSTFTLYGIAAA